MPLSLKTTPAVRGATGVPGRRAYRDGMPPAFVRPAYRRRARRLRRVLRAAAVVAALALVALIAAHLATHLDSVVVLAAREMPSVAVNFYQEDAAWSEDILGNTGKTLGKAGDGVACLAALIAMQGLTVPTEGEINPGTLNVWLTENDAYDAEGGVLWAKVAKLLGVNLMEVSPRRGMEALLTQLLEQDIYPVVTVRRPDTGAAHDVLVAGSVHGEFIVMDPLDPMEVLDTLGLYDNRIYGLKALVPKT